MPIHDWTRVEAGIFHDFHQAWTIRLRDALNMGALPEGYFALADQIIGGPIPDVVTMHWKSPPKSRRPIPRADWVAVAEKPPQAAIISEARQRDVYAQRADRIVIKHSEGQVVAVIEIVSPGNKSKKQALRMFIDKACTLIEQGIHLLIVDLFPASDRDPQGIHAAIWEELGEDAFALPEGKPLTCVSYCAGANRTAYVEPVRVGDELPSLPLFLTPYHYVPSPLESTYLATWDSCPDPVRELVEPQD